MSKFDYYLKKIEERYPLKNRFNQREVCEIIEISPAKFNYIINRNELYKLPKFSYEEKIRKNGNIYRTYKFDIYDIVEFLSIDC